MTFVEELKSAVKSLHASSGDKPRFAICGRYFWDGLRAEVRGTGWTQLGSVDIPGLPMTLDMDGFVIRVELDISAPPNAAWVLSERPENNGGRLSARIEHRISPATEHRGYPRSSTNWTDEDQR